MRVAKWGNSLAVRLPRDLVEALDLKEGDEVEIGVATPRKFEMTKTPDRDALIETLRALRGTLPADYRFDRDEANERR